MIGNEVEFLCELFNRFPGRRVDDGRNVFLQQFFQDSVFFIEPGTCHDRKREIRPFESRYMELHRRTPQLFQNVAADFAGCCCRERADLPDRIPFRCLAEFQIGWTEIVSPLTDAVGFVHNHDFRRSPGEKILKGIRLKTFRCNIKNFDESRFRIFENPELFPHGDCGIDVSRRDAFFAKGVHLVLHQRDQGGDHDAVAFTEQNRQLIAEGFSRTGRHYDTEIFSRHDFIDDLFLIIQKRVKSEILLECDGDPLVHVSSCQKFRLLYHEKWFFQWIGIRFRENQCAFRSGRLGSDGALVFFFVFCSSIIFLRISPTTAREKSEPVFL